ncbi:hypothetical protein ACFYNO_20160 [Kitasatospora sp. NPDC006697]|uniref:hypothetical protein n=1 Tax=Kitasatospora sp. NPDC006697 TaxID=3364020 RepID=UPI0036BB52D3
MSTAPMFVNNATLVYDISFVDGPDFADRIDTHSHGGQIYSYYESYPEPTDHPGLQGYQHDQDGEKLAINIFANRLYRHLGCTDNADYRRKIATVRRGRLQLNSTMGPCHSCRRMLRAFLDDFPAVTLEVTYGNSGRRGGSARELQAGEGLYGVYGYADAVQLDPPRGSWFIAFPGTPRTRITAEYEIRFKPLSTGGQGVTSTGTAWAVAGSTYAPFIYRSPGTAGSNEVAEVLDDIAKELRKTIGGKPDKRDVPGFREHMSLMVSGGSLTLHADQGPDQDGRRALEVFRTDFPRVEVTFHYAAPNALEAGRGYRDAQADGPGNWTRGWYLR